MVSGLFDVGVMTIEWDESESKSKMWNCSKKIKYTFGCFGRSVTFFFCILLAHLTLKVYFYSIPSLASMLFSSGFKLHMYSFFSSSVRKCIWLNVDHHHMIIMIIFSTLLPHKFLRKRHKKRCTHNILRVVTLSFKQFYPIYCTLSARASAIIVIIAKIMNYVKSKKNMHFMYVYYVFLAFFGIVYCCWWQWWCCTITVVGGGGGGMAWHGGEEKIKNKVTLVFIDI